MIHWEQKEMERRSHPQRQSPSSHSGSLRVSDHQVTEYVGLQSRHVHACKTADKMVQLLGKGKPIDSTKYWGSTSAQFGKRSVEWDALMYYYCVHPDLEAFNAVRLRWDTECLRLREQDLHSEVQSFEAWIPADGGAELSQEEKSMQNVSHEITKYMRARVGHVEYRAAEAESQLQTQQSNFVMEFIEDNSVVLHYGRIRYFFEHYFPGREEPSQLVCMDWFRKVSRDQLTLAPIVNIKPAAAVDREHVMDLSLLTDLVLLGAMDSKTAASERYVISLHTHAYRVEEADDQQLPLDKPKQSKAAKHKQKRARNVQR